MQKLRGKKGTTKESFNKWSALKIYILSPHIDDAAFGLAQTIFKCTNNKIAVTIINCFTVTKWTAIHVENKEIDAVSRLRKSEDAQFYTAFNGNINIINLDLLDAPLRNGYIFQQEPFQQNELELVEELKKLLELHVDGLLLCPLGIGHHIDHAICREAIAQLYKNMKVLFYEDLPYANRITFTEITTHVKELAERLQVQLFSYINSFQNCTLDKEQAIRAYKSQMNDEICSEIVAHMNALSGERLWGEAKVIKDLKRVLAG